MAKFIFLGGKAIGDFQLKSLINAKRFPSGVICYREIIEAEVLDLCIENNIPILKVNQFAKEISSISEFVNEIKPDVLLSVAFPFIIPKEILKLVKYPINLHTSLLPQYRGHHPIVAAFLNDEKFQGVSLHLMAEIVDDGNVIEQRKIDVLNEDTIISVRDKMMNVGFEVIENAFVSLSLGELKSTPQEGKKSWALKRKPSDSKINFNQNSRVLHNFIRTLVDPYPNAFYNKENGEVINFKKSISSNIPGKVLAQIDRFNYVISTLDGVVFVETDTELKIGEILN